MTLADNKLKFVVCLVGGDALHPSNNFSVMWLNEIKRKKKSFFFFQKCNFESISVNHDI